MGRPFGVALICARAARIPSALIHMALAALEKSLRSVQFEFGGVEIWAWIISPESKGASGAPIDSEFGPYRDDFYKFSP